MQRTGMAAEDGEKHELNFIGQSAWAGRNVDENRSAKAPRLGSAFGSGAWDQ